MRGLKAVAANFAGMALIAMLFSMIAVPALAQLATGTMLGVVKDASGAVVSGATVTIQNNETSQTRTVTTGADGAYRVPALPVGHYTLKFEARGFNTQTQQGLVLEVAQDLVVNASLQVGTAVQEVVVTGEAPLVNTTSSALGSLVNEQRMTELPLNGRNYIDLTLMQPGVSQQTTSSGGGAGISGTWFSVNGAPVRSNNYTMDGAIMVNAYGASTSSEAGTTLGVDGIREYKIVTSAFSAEYGLTMGSQMVIVSKGGSNAFHGDAFEYLRNSALDARNYFDAAASSGGRRLPEFQRNNFGGSFGGPIRRDKTFFFGVYEGLRQNLGVTINDTVIPAACHNLVTSPVNTAADAFRLADAASAAACNGTVTGALALTTAKPIPALIKPFIDLYPIPNLPNNGWTTPANSRQREDFGQFRVDQNFSAADTLFFRYTLDKGDLNNATASTSVTPAGAAFPQYFKILGTSMNQYATVSESHVFSSTLLNTARLSFSRTNFGADNLYSKSFVSPQYSFIPGRPMGTLGIQNLTTMGPNGGYPTFHLQDVYTLSDDVLYTRGRHGLKFGALINRYNSSTDHTKLTQGQLNFTNAATFMQGIYQNYAGLTPGATLNRYFTYYTYGFYAQDDMRVSSRLTLNAGLRYEFETTPTELQGRQSRFLNLTDPSQTWSLGPVMRNPTLKNFSPRIGFAWDVRGNGKTAIRAAFGIYEDVGNIGSALQQSANSMPPFSTSGQVTSNLTNKVIAIPFTFGVANSLQTVDYNVRQPYSEQYNLTVEQQLPWGTGLAVSYVGFNGHKLWQTREGNPCVPTSFINGLPFWSATTSCPNKRENPNWGTAILTTTSGQSWYNSLQVMVNKPLSHGLQFQSAYTWSKSLDTTQGQMYASDCAASGGLQGVDPFNSLVDKGPSCFDVAQTWHFNLLYHLPNLQSDHFLAKLEHGWWVGNIVTVQGGFPFTPVLTVNRSNSGVLNGQADRVYLGTDNVTTTIKGVTYNFIPFNKDTVITGDPNMWFNPMMFRLGPAGSLGNASRDMLRGPGLSTWNLSVNKDTKLPHLGEGGMLQFRAEMFNLLNRTNFSLPNSGAVFTGTVTDAAGATEAPVNNVGQIKSTATTSRQIQLALKIIF